MNNTFIYIPPQIIITIYGNPYLCIGRGEKE